MKKTVSTMMFILAFGIVLRFQPLMGAQDRIDPSTKTTEGMALIPAGEFWMGKDHYFLVDEVGWMERDRRDDTPAHKTYVDAFYIDKYEVTSADYAKFLEANARPRPWYWPSGKIAPGEERHPIHDVNWDEANAYCHWTGKRLPSEAEWERAARGDLDRKSYPWGDERLGLSGYDANSESAGKHAHANYPFGPAVVGSYPPNQFGLYDMAGNVWEWVNDWYGRDYYSVSPAQNPPGPATGVYKVIRGGGWSDDDERNLRNHYRNYAAPSMRTYTIGFRCAKR